MSTPPIPQEHTPRERTATDWPAIAILFAGGLVASMHFAKLAPVMDKAGAALGMGPVMAGLSVSILGVVGILFAIPAGTIAGALGLGRGLAIALFGGAALAGLGAIAPGATLFLAVRLLEGFSHLLIVICAPPLMSAHASPRDRPVVLALWGCFFGLGFAMTSASAPVIVEAFAWRGLLMAHALAMVAVGLATLGVLARSGHRDVRGAWPAPIDLWRAHAAVYRSGAPVLLALVFMTYALQFLAIVTFLGPLLSERPGWSAETVGAIVSATSLGTLVFTLLAGVLVRHGLGLRPGIGLAYGLVIAGTLLVFVVRPEAPILLAGIALLTVGLGLLPGLVFATVPVVAPTAAAAALAYGAIAQFGNVGTFSGTPIFAWLHGLLGWGGGAAFVVVTAIAGVLLAAAVERSRAPFTKP